MVVTTKWRVAGRKGQRHMHHHEMALIPPPAIIPPCYPHDVVFRDTHLLTYRPPNPPFVCPVSLPFGTSGHLDASLTASQDGSGSVIPMSYRLQHSRRSTSRSPAVLRPSSVDNLTRQHLYTEVDYSAVKDACVN